ncbi:sulfurtransferase complex subunit TusC [Thalassotalea aquiviva]|uniref:sulfurtransferase complex subunit TusC n=1 Tax=Thalassotalea aquiviva TaxID=3242415 RepID=UPI003529D4FF
MSANAAKPAKHYAIINSQSTFHAGIGKEALDAALILASYELKVSMFFIGDGVYQIQKNQLPQEISHKDYVATFQALEFYDIEDIYICKASLQARQLSEQSVFEHANIVAPADIKQSLADCDVVLTF